MAVNKVIYGDRTLVDLTQDSVNEDNLLEGETAHDASGNPVTGTAKQGHIVQDTNGTDMPQEENLQFVGVYTEDDSTNEKTKVNIVREMTSTQMQSLTTAQKKGFIRTTDEPDNPYNNTGKHIRRTLTFANGYSDINTNTDADIRGRATIGVFPTADANGLSYVFFPFNYGTGLLRIYGYQYPQSTAILDGTSIAVDIVVY